MPRSLATLLAAGVLAGCGTQASEDTSDRFRGDERLVAQAVEDLQTSATRGDEQRLCSDVLARELIRRLEQSGTRCVQAVEEAIQDADAYDLAVEDVTVRGDRATARVKADAGERDETDVLELVKERGRWRITALRAQA